MESSERPDCLKRALAVSHAYTSNNVTAPTDSIATNVEASEKKAYFDAHYIAPDVFRLQANPLLIETGEKRILIDTGLGPSTGWAVHAGRLTKSLEAAGITPDSIDAIVLTHCHPDHIGGFGTDPAKQFPNADLILSEPSWTSGIHQTRRLSCQNGRPRARLRCKRYLRRLATICIRSREALMW
jgi:metal-dependent hydrolase (beta-lactamase superfamily II)